MRGRLRRVPQPYPGTTVHNQNHGFPEAKPAAGFFSLHLTNSWSTTPTPAGPSSTPVAGRQPLKLNPPQIPLALFPSSSPLLQRRLQPKSLPPPAAACASAAAVEVGTKSPPPPLRHHLSAAAAFPSLRLQHPTSPYPKSHLIHRPATSFPPLSSAPWYASVAAWALGSRAWAGRAQWVSPFSPPELPSPCVRRRSCWAYSPPSPACWISRRAQAGSRHPQQTSLCLMWESSLPCPHERFAVAAVADVAVTSRRESSCDLRPPFLSGRMFLRRFRHRRSH